MGAPLGNQNGAKAKKWADAIRKALADAELDDKPYKLRDLARVLCEKASEGDLAALKELGDRLDGKPAQAIVGEADGEPIKHVFAWKND